MRRPGWKFQVPHFVTSRWTGRSLRCQTGRCSRCECFKQPVIHCARRDDGGSVRLSHRSVSMRSEAASKLWSLATVCCSCSGWRAEGRGSNHRRWFFGYENLLIAEAQHDQHGEYMLHAHHCSGSGLVGRWLHCSNGSSSWLKGHCLADVIQGWRHVFSLSCRTGMHFTCSKGNGKHRHCRLGTRFHAWIVGRVLSLRGNRRQSWACTLHLQLFSFNFVDFECKMV